MIDVHAHLFFDALLGRAGDLGPRLETAPDGSLALTTGGYTFPLGHRTSIEVTPKQRVEDLDSAGIDVQIVSGSPLWYFHHSPAELAVPFARQFNDCLAEFAAAEPDRLKAVAVLPAQDTGAAIAELDRCVNDLGLAGAMIGTDARIRLDDPDLDDLYAAFEELEVPLLIHSTIAGVDGPPPEERFRRFKNELTIGHPFQETEAVLTLVLGGVLRRHPGLEVCLPHGAGTLPYVYQRIRAFMGALPDAPVTPEVLDADFGRLWFDTHVHGTGPLRLLIEVVGPERLVFGTNFGAWDTGTVDELENTGIDADANARRLFRRAFAG